MKPKGKRLFVFVLMMAGVCLFHTACREQPGKWNTLAALTNSFGETFCVRQEHYDRWEGWNVGFGFVDRFGASHWYYLASESLPWSNVILCETNQSVHVFKYGLQVADFNRLTGSFSNHLNGVTYMRSAALQ